MSRKPDACMLDGDSPEWAAEDFARARPIREADPGMLEAVAAFRRRGRPPVASPKVRVGFRLAADVVNGIRATGRGYNARVEKVLREALAEGRL
ncbi:MAG TPA: BrnA antitoxin family protein [Geminicoccaceae bacterium]|nr:BrnA antitoxin family protein [Geminicoccaceae bacterium]